MLQVQKRRNGRADIVVDSIRVELNLQRQTERPLPSYSLLAKFVGGETSGSQVSPRVGLTPSGHCRMALEEIMTPFLYAPLLV